MRRVLRASDDVTTVDATRIGGEGILTRRAILIHSPDRPIAGLPFSSGYSKAVDENVDKMGHNAFKYKAFSPQGFLT